MAFSSPLVFCHEKTCSAEGRGSVKRVTLVMEMTVVGATGFCSLEVLKMGGDDSQRQQGLLGGGGDHTGSDGMWGNGRK